MRGKEVKETMFLRKCKGSYMDLEHGKWVEKEFELGYFHEWSINYEEFDNGIGNFPIAIVELPNGKIITPTATDISFINCSQK